MKICKKGRPALAFSRFQRRGEKGDGREVSAVFQHAQFRGQLPRVGAQQHVAALGQRAGVDHHGAAHAVHGSGFMNMAAEADVGLGFLVEKFTEEFMG